MGDEAGTGAEPLKMVREAHWHVVLMDISMPDMDGIEAFSANQADKS